MGNLEKGTNLIANDFMRVFYVSVKYQGAYIDGQSATKALRGIIDKFGRFDRKMLLNFLRFMSMR